MCWLLGGVLTIPVRAQPIFQDASLQISQSLSSTPIVETGSGVDFNRDGFIDIYAPGRLYVNRGNGFFSEQRSQVGIDVPDERNASAVWGDYDNDGLLDLAHLSPSNGITLYANRGSSQLERMEGILPERASEPRSGFWADMDADGWLDLVIGGISEITIYWNQGGARFEETTFSFTNVFNFDFAVCAASGADYDQDNDIDIFLGVCQEEPGSRFNQPNLLMRNEGDGTFSEVAQEAGILDQFGNYDTSGGIWFDYDNDGWVDLLVIRDGRNIFQGLQGGPLLFRNDQQGRFENVTSVSGVDAVRAAPHNGGVVTDFDNDGWQDVLLRTRVGSDRDAYLHNNGDGTFALMNLDLGPDLFSAKVVGDFDNNGWVDVWKNGFRQDFLYLNQPQENHWVRLQLVGTTSNRFGVGASVTVYAQGREYLRSIITGQGDGAQHDNLTAHIGLGTTNAVDSIFVRWPSGHTDRLAMLAVDQQLTLVEGQGLNSPPLVQLEGPEDGSRVATGTPHIVFDWAATDPNNDDLAYTFFLKGSRFATTMTALTDTEVQIPTTMLDEGGRFEWNVQATDGFSIMQSRTASFFVFAGRAPSLSPVRFPLAIFSRGDIALGDWDGDRDLDYAASGWVGTGVTRATIYALQDTNFVELDGEVERHISTKIYKQATVVQGVAEGGLDWVDINGDGAFELFMHGLRGAGRDTSPFPVSMLYSNANGTFQPIQSFEGVFHSHAAWGDYDDDGDDDLLLAGATTQDPPANPITRLYRNTEGQLEPVNTAFPGMMHGSAAWGDYDNDGHLDLVMMGDAGHGHFVTRLYRGNGEGQFEEVEVPLPEWAFGSVAWADYDADGDLDLLQTGGTLDAAQLIRGATRLYRNDSGQFSEAAQTFNSAYQGVAAWGDYDADGDPDVIIHGSTSVFGDRTASVFLNQGGLFVLDETTRFAGGLHAKIAAGDYNNDGDLDLLFFKQAEDRRISLDFYINCQVPEEILPDLLPRDAAGAPIKPCVP